MAARKPDLRIASIELARELERCTSTLRAARSQLAEGPFRRTRRRLDKQLRKLDGVLTEVQRMVIAAPAEAPIARTVRDELQALLDQLAQVTAGPATKHDLKQARLAVKRVRVIVAAHLDDLAGAAA